MLPFLFPIFFLFSHLSDGKSLEGQASSRPTALLGATIVVGKTSQVPTSPQLMANQYLGIPYAKSPPRRFEPPSEPQPLGRSWDASYFRPSCIQYFGNTEFIRIFNDPPLPESEDCLYLNIFIPSDANSKGLPVLFWIHGGSFAFGSARLPDYDGSSIAAAQGVIVVTVNYRTGVYGFPGSSTIPLERRNVGLLDQRRALSWVSKNIHAFGGDPSRVTIFGESAGAWSVKQLLIHPPSHPQFQAAILQSQAFGPEVDNEASWNILVQELGCIETGSPRISLDCVSKAPVESIRVVLENHKLGFAPIADNATNGPVFQDALKENLTSLIPVMIGTNADEGTVLVSAMPPAEALFNTIFGNDTAAKQLARSQYPRHATDAELQSLVTTDYTYTCTTSAIARALAKAEQKVWRYFFNASFPNNQPIAGAKAWHTSEIPIVFGTYRQDIRTTSAQILLSRTMQQAWGNFAKDPESGPGWAALGMSRGVLRNFDADEAVSGQSVNEDAIDGKCIYYNTYLETNGY